MPKNAAVESLLQPYVRFGCRSASAGVRISWHGRTERFEDSLRSIDNSNESTDDLQKVVRAWNAEYARGRYDNEPPIAFVNDILEAAHKLQLIGARGLYVGCGNGRNYVPLVAGGLDLVGIDISELAI